MQEPGPKAVSQQMPLTGKLKGVERSISLSIKTKNNYYKSPRNLGFNMCLI